jgi:hypothetical protein
MLVEVAIAAPCMHKERSAESSVRLSADSEPVELHAEVSATLSHLAPNTKQCDACMDSDRLNFFV